MGGRKFVVGGNWKCNGSRETIKTLAGELSKLELPDDANAEVIVAPPFLYAAYAKDLLPQRFELGVQNCWIGKSGAFTGEISAEMIKDMGIKWVILGHSERRHLQQLKESDETVGEKVGYALSQGLHVMPCVGELLEEREAERTREVNERQLRAIAEKVTDWSRVVLAYEPVWAIGTGKVATPEQAQEVHAQLRGWLRENVSADVAEKLPIVYGGSVNAKNCGELAKQRDVDGFLVGGASLKPEFTTIVSAYKQK